MSSDHRDPMSHSGFLKIDVDREEEWTAIERDRDLLRTLVNRVVLALLGYEGDAREYPGLGVVRVAPSPASFE